MKKVIVVSALAMLAAFSAGAQMMPDSTVQVIAYWDKGEKVMYKVENSTKQIYKSGEEKVLSSSSEKDCFEVVDQTDTSYILRLTMKDVVTSSLDDPLDPKWRDEFIKQKGHKLNSKQKERLKALTGGLATQIGDPDALYNNTVPTLTNMLFFHGLRLDTAKVYNVNTKIDNILNHSFDAEQSFWVDPAQSDTTFVVIKGVASLGNDTLMPYLEESVMGRLRESTADEDEFNQSWEQWLQEAVDTHLQVTFDKYWLWVIHLPSGWPTHVEIMTETKVTSDDEEIKTVSDYRLVFEDQM